MREGTRNALVGLFVCASLIVFGALMVMFGEMPSWLISNEWELRIVGVSGLRGIGDGSPVSLNGVEIGRVDRLEFQRPDRPDRGAIIVVNIKREYIVPRGARAKVYGATFGIGTGHVDIMVAETGSMDPLPTDGGSISGEMASMIGEIITKGMVDSFERTIVNIGDFADSGTDVAKNVAELLEARPVDRVDYPPTPSDRVPANLATLIERIDDLAKHLNTVLGDVQVQEDVRGMVTDLKAATEGLRDLVAQWKTETTRIAENLNTGIDRTDENLNAAITNLIAATEKLDDTVKDLASIMHGISQGEGTLGLLVRDPRVYESGNLALERIAEWVASLQRITDKIERDGYITLAQTTALGTFKKDFPIGQGKKDAEAE